MVDYDLRRAQTVEQAQKRLDYLDTVFAATDWAETFLRQKNSDVNNRNFIAFICVLVVQTPIILRGKLIRPEHVDGALVGAPPAQGERRSTPLVARNKP